MTFNTNFNEIVSDRTVYVRAVDADELPDEVKEQIGEAQVYAVHRSDGARLALVKDRAMAFALARKNDYAPVTVH